MYFGEVGSIIVGANGQDGILISEILGKENKPILRIDRGSIWNQGHLVSKVSDLEPKFLSSILTEFNVGEIYFFAAHSRSTQDQLGVSPEVEKSSHHKVELLLKLVTEAIALQPRHVSLVFASSMRIFEGYENVIANELTEPFPTSLYSDHKIKCMEFLEKQNNNIKNMTSIIPILFNHESIHRKSDYLTSKVIQSALESKVRLSRVPKTEILSPNSVRDFGYAPQFMEVLIQLARQNLGGTYILCTGTVMSVNEFIEIACAEIGVPVSNAFKIEESTRLTSQNVTVRGDNTRILRQLGYEDGYFLSHKNLVSKLVDDWREVLNFE